MLTRALTIFVAMTALPVIAGSYYIHSFERLQLTDTYYSEGVGVGDLNGDDQPDVVHGPFWFEGPGFEVRHEIYTPEPQPREKYADNFFSWVHDFDGDGWNDVFVVGFPGTPAYVYENPGEEADTQHWAKHEVFDWVSNESPHFTQLVGDDRPELICTRDGYFGYATVDWERPFEAWTFHKISEQVAPKRFGHGLGVGDVNGDGRQDVLMKGGWYRQPSNPEAAKLWEFYPVTFTEAGGAEMYAYDVDGDGDNDVITSLQAHDYGLAWFEQYEDDGAIAFRKHLIMGETPEDNRYGVLFTEPHSVALADMDGDGLKDIVTGKTYWSHHRQSPMWDAGAVVYWFKLVRGEDGIRWIPFQADDQAGIGRQVTVADVNRDNLPDIVTGGMKGSHVLLHSRREVSKEEWESSLPPERKDQAAGLTPEEAANHMTAPPGFNVQLAAGEPRVHQPIAFTLDTQGRLWVAEAYTYPQRAPEDEGKDKIIILEDQDDDGSFETRKEFITGLNLVSGLEVGFGGVWVGAAPYLLFIPDRDGDDQPDGEPQVLLDGFGYQDTHETLNSFTWGPDGWLYGCHGVFTHSRVGKPGTPDSERQPLNAGVWRYHPTRHEFEVFAYGTSNPWGVDFNDYGQPFITACVIPHLYHVVQGARYQRQGGQHFNSYVYDDIKTIADHLHYAGNIRDHAWWGSEPELPADTSAAGGGHAHCGAMIYLGDNWPEQYRNNLFMNNIHGNRVNQDILERQGSGFVGHHGADFLFANDKWFRGIDLQYGPDGSVYVIDWYDPNACHRVNPEIWDRTNGRIYNVAYGEPEERDPDLKSLKDLELVRLQLHDNDWYVRTARRLLQERSHSGTLDRDAVKELKSILHGDAEVPQKLRALWALHAVERIDRNELMGLLQHASEYMRGWAVQLLLENRPDDPALTERLASLARNDSSSLVRLYLASGLQRLPLELRWNIAGALIQHGEDAGDQNLPLMIWYGMESLVPQDSERALDLALRSELPRVTRFIMRRSAQDETGLNELVSRLPDMNNDTRRIALQQMLEGFKGRADIPMPKSWEPAFKRLMQTSDESLEQLVQAVAVEFGDDRIFPHLRAVLRNESADLEKRRNALRVLIRGQDPEAVPALIAALEQPELRPEAIRALAGYDGPAIPKALLAGYPDWPQSDRREAIATLVSRAKFAFPLLDAMEAGKVPRTDLHAYHIRQLTSFENAQLTERVRDVWGDIRQVAGETQERIEHYKELIQSADTAADKSNGRKLYNQICASCHTLFGEGGNVGPDITGSDRANLDYILENMAAPSAVVGRDYQMTTVETTDGRIVSGIVKQETDSAVTIQTITDEVVVAKSKIGNRDKSELSMMPEGLLEALNAKQVRDLVAYLGSPSQVPLRGPSAPINAETGKVPNALEGEELKVAGKTAGSAQSQPMGSFQADRWSGNSQLWWTGAKPGDKLDLELPAPAQGTYTLELVLTKARDYGVVQLYLDDKKLGQPIDGFNSAEVITTGVLTFENLKLSEGKHELTLEIVGAHPKAIEAYMVGLDYVRLVPADAQLRTESR